MRDPLGVAAATSMHGNGHVREAAVVELGELESGPELRWLLLRTVDWVSPVSELATQLVHSRLTPANRVRYATWLVDALPFVASQRFRESTAVAALRAEIHDVCLDRAVTDALWDGLEHRDRAVRRAATHALASHNDEILRLLLAVRPEDPVSMAEVAAAALANDAVCQQAALLLSRSTLPRVRAAALWHLTHHDHEYSGQLADALGDRSAAVRDVAQRVVGRDGGDALVYYRAAIDERPLAALLGLGDLGTVDDADIAARYVDDPGRVGIAAMRVIARKGDARHLPMLLDAALRGDGGRADAATKGLARSVVSEEIAELAWDEARHAPALRQKRILRYLVGRSNRWSRLQIGLRASVAADEDLRDLGSATIDRVLASWNSSATRPTQHQLDEIRRHLASRAHNLSLAIATEVADLIRYW
ncbi:MAG: hypothetical protein ABI658_23410 [Acidimicrobiales bacterium]